MSPNAERLRRDTTLRKGLKLLEVLVREGELGLGQLAALTGLSKGNAHGILQTLTDEGYVAQTAPSSPYRATLKLWEIGVARAEQPDLVGPSLAAMEALCRETRETVILALLDGSEVLYLHRIDSPEAVRSFTRVGERAPACCVATGKAMLAFDQRGETFWRSLPLARHSKTSITDVDAFVTDMKATQARGYSINNGEWRGAVRGLAAPIFGWDSRVRLALGVAGPGERLPPERLVQIGPVVVEAAGAVAAALGACATVQRHEQMEKDFCDG